MKAKLQLPIFHFLTLIFLSITISCSDKDKSDPEPIPVSEPAKIYVANEHAGTISVIDAVSRKVIKTIYINAGANTELMAHNVQVSPDGKSVWVTGVPMDHLTPEELICINAETDAIKYRKQMPMHLHMAHVVFDDASAFAYVTATDAGLVLQVNTQTFHTAKIYTLPTGTEPHGLRFFQGKLYVANLKAKSISVIDVVSGQVQQIPVGGMAVQTAVSPDGKFIFASLFDTKEVVLYNLQTQALDRIPLPAEAQGPIQLYPTSDSKKLLVADQGVLLNRPVSDKIFIIDIETATVTKTLTAGEGTHGIVVSRDGKFAYATNTEAGTVTVVDLAAEKVVATIPVDYTPNGISYRFETGGMP